MLRASGEIAARCALILAMISDETRRRLWGEKEEAGRLQLYYEALGTRRSRF